MGLGSGSMGSDFPGGGLLQGRIDSSPFDGLINAEIHAVQGDAREGAADQVIGAALDSALSPGLRDVAEDRQRVSWLTSWFVKDLGVSTPSEMLEFVERADSEASKMWPGARLVDRLFKYAKAREKWHG